MSSDEYDLDSYDPGKCDGPGRFTGYPGVRMNPADVGKMGEQFNPAEIKPLVVIESPYAGDIERNLAYVRAAIRDSIMRGEAPVASHALYTQPGVLLDNIPAERELGMGIGWHIMRRASLVAVYIDLGWSSGMKRGVDAATLAGKNIVQRTLGPPGTWLENYEAGRPAPDFAVIKKGL